jgi:hypothetical protein
MVGCLRTESPGLVYHLEHIVPVRAAQIVRRGGGCYNEAAPGSSAAWLARSVRDAEAEGSNPSSPTIDNP